MPKLDGIGEDVNQISGSVSTTSQLDGRGRSRALNPFVGLQIYTLVFMWHTPKGASRQLSRGISVLSEPLYLLFV